MQVLEPLQERRHVAIGVVDLLDSRGEPAHAGLAQIDDAGSLAAPEKLLDQIDGRIHPGRIGAHLAVIDKTADADRLLQCPTGQSDPGLRPLAAGRHVG
jgi:hypothetical protein